jgi:hypothetical protein
MVGFLAPSRGVARTGRVLAIPKRGYARTASACAKKNHWNTEMKHQRHFERASDGDVALREVARISALISDLDRVVRILDSDIATEEERARMSNPFDASYPILARTLTARRDNLKGTIAALERRLAGLDRAEQVPA